jgi:hypothetical protein
VLAIGREMGYEFPFHTFDDTPGHFYASHAEKQLNALRPGEPIGVSLPMAPTVTTSSTPAPTRWGGRSW